MDLDELQGSYRAAREVMDEVVQQLVAFHVNMPRQRMDTLSSSSGDPVAHHAEMVLSTARVLVQSCADRDALLTIARACYAQGVFDEAALGRLLKEFHGA